MIGSIKQVDGGPGHPGKMWDAISKITRTKEAGGLTQASIRDGAQTPVLTKK
jgi:hypothetical protein